MHDLLIAQNLYYIHPFPSQHISQNIDVMGALSLRSLSERAEKTMCILFPTGIKA